MKYLVLIWVIAMSGCKEVELKGDVFAKIYPNDGYADTVIVESQDPVKVSEASEVSLDQLSGWIAVPEEQFAKYRRAYERELDKSSVIEKVQEKFIQKRTEDFR